MKTVYKYELSPAEQTVISLPFGAQVLRIDTQNNGVFLWAVVDTKDIQPEERIFEVYGTGHAIREDGNERKFINTFFMQGGTYVFHAFEVIEP